MNEASRPCCLGPGSSSLELCPWCGLIAWGLFIPSVQAQKKAEGPPTLRPGADQPELRLWPGGVLTLFVTRGPLRRSPQGLTDGILVTPTSRTCSGATPSLPVETPNCRVSPTPR